MNYIALFTSDIVGFICGLLSSVFVARHLGPKIYGSYIFIMLILAYFQHFGRFRESVSILPYLKNHSEHEKTIFSLGFLINCLMGTITTFMLIAIGSFFSLFSDFSDWIYPLLSLMIFCEYFLIFTTYALSYQAKFKLLAGLTTIRPVLQTAGFAYLYFFANSQKAVLQYFIVNAGAMLLTALVGAYLIRNYINLSFLQYREINIKLYVKNSLLFYLTDIVDFFTKKGVATFVAAKLAVSNLAYFSMIFTHFDLLRFPNSALGTMMYPALSKETSDKKQRAYISHKVFFNFLIFPPILVAAFFLYPKLVILFYGPEYEIITHYFPYILLIGAPYLITYPISHYFSSNGAPHFEGIINVLSLSLQIISVLLFSYLKDFSLLFAVLSQAFGFAGFTFALLFTYKYRRLNSHE